jgi:hypothetical protein
MWTVALRCYGTTFLPYLLILKTLAYQDVTFESIRG